MFRKFLAIALALPLFSIGLPAAQAAASPWSENFDSMANFSGTDFDGNTSSIVSDQPAGEGFTSGKAIKMANQGAAWAGTKFVLATTRNLISSTNSTASISVYSPDALDRCFNMKLENSANPGLNTEKIVHVTQGWQTINVTYTYDATRIYNVVALMPNIFDVGCKPNSTNKALTTWYVDNISFPGSVDGEVIKPETRTTPQVLINFESTDSSGYALTDFGGNSSSLVTDAPAGGSTGSTKSLKIVTQGGEAGTTLVVKSSKTSLISLTGFVAKANIYSPVAGKKIMLQIGSSVDPSQVVKIDQTSVAGWKTYSFNFEVGGNLEIDYSIATIFFSYLQPNT